MGWLRWWGPNPLGFKQLPRWLDWIRCYNLTGWSSILTGLGGGGGGLKILDLYIFIIIFFLFKNLNLWIMENMFNFGPWSFKEAFFLVGFLRHKLMIYDSCKLHFLLTAKSWTEVTEKLSWVLHVDLLVLIKYHLKIFQVTDSLCSHCACVAYLHWSIYPLLNLSTKMAKIMLPNVNYTSHKWTIFMFF